MKSLLTLFLSVFLIVSVSFSQELNETNTYLEGNASYKLQQEIELVPPRLVETDPLYQWGVVTQTFSTCAKSYKITADVLLAGTRFGAGGGLTLRAVNDDNSFSNLVELNVWNAGKGYQDGINAIVLLQSEDSYNAVNTPYDVAEAGWLKFEYIATENGSTASLINGDIRTEISGNRLVKTGRAVKNSFFGWAGAGSSTYKVKNAVITVIEDGFCDKLDITGVNQLLLDTCGEINCENYIEKSNCYSSLVSNLFANENLSSSVNEELVGTIESRIQYCDGFTGGRNSVVCQEPIVCPDIPIPTPAACPEQVVCPGPTTCNEIPIEPITCPTPVVCPEQDIEESDGPEDGTINFNDAVDQLCPCNRAPTHGAYVRCVSKISRRLIGLTSAVDRSSLVAAAAKSQCGRKQTNIQ